MTDRKQLFEEIQSHLLRDHRPSAYLTGVSAEEIFRAYPFSMLRRLKEVPQSPKHHPEGNVWNHTMLVVDEAAGQREKSKDPTAFMWAALLHDLGKADTTRRREKGRITAYDHDKAGARQAEEFLEVFLEDRELIRRVTALVRWHMQVLFVIKSMEFAEIGNMLKEVDEEEIALLGYCDRMGRLGADRKAEEANLGVFMKKCNEFITQTR